MNQVLLRVLFLGFASLFFSQMALAKAPSTTPKTSKTPKPISDKAKARVLHNLRVAQAKSSNTSSSNDELKLEQVAPRGAWVLESVAVTVAAAGFITLAVGATFLGRRDQLVNEYESATDPNNSNPFAAFTGTPEPPDAKEVKELQDNGFALLYTGIIVAGVGLVGMVVGGIWILAHKPPASAPPKNASAKKNITPLAKTTTPSHTLTLHQGQF